MEKRISGKVRESKIMIHSKSNPQQLTRTNRRREAMQVLLGVPRSYLSLTCLVITTLITSLIVALWFLNQKHSIQEHCIEPGTVTSVGIFNVSDSSLMVIWEEPDLANISVTGYSVTLKDDEGQLVKRVSTHESQHTFTRLHPWTLYHVDVAAYNIIEECTGGIHFGAKVSASALTDPRAPSMPTEPIVDEATNDSIIITWEKPHIPNGPVNGYIVRNANAFPKQEMTTVHSNYTARGLKPWTKYRFTISAFNSLRGSPLIGPEVTVEAQTAVSTPGAPARPLVGTVTNTSIQIMWEAPKTPNGPIDGYIVKILGASSDQEFTTKGTSFIFPNLQPWTMYVFSVNAFNLYQESRLTGPAANVNGRTAGLPPPIPSKRISIVSTDQNAASLVIPLDLFSNANGPVVEYVLLVVQSEYEASVQEMGYDGLDKAHFLSWSEAQRTDHWYRSSPKNWNYKNDNRNCKYYNEGSRLCRIGLDRSCSFNDKFCNGHLRPNTKYWAKIKGYTDFGWSESLPVSFYTEAEPVRNEDHFPAVPRTSYNGKNAAARSESVLSMFALTVFVLYIFNKA